MLLRERSAALAHGTSDVDDTVGFGPKASSAGHLTEGGHVHKASIATNFVAEFACGRPCCRQARRAAPLLSQF
jgi:hypothetical protein